MKKNEMKLLRLAAPVFNESEWTTLNKRLTHYNLDVDRDEVLKLYFYVNKKDASISTIYLSLERDECSKIEIYINIDTERAFELYNKFDRMCGDRREFEKDVFEFFTKNPKHYDYDADKDAYSVAYSYLILI